MLFFQNKSFKGANHQEPSRGMGKDGIEISIVSTARTK